MEFQESEKKIFLEKFENELNPTEEEFEIAVKKVRTCNDKIWEDYECNTCRCFAHDPVNCSNCEFLACNSCFLKFES